MAAGIQHPPTTLTLTSSPLHCSSNMVSFIPLLTALAAVSTSFALTVASDPAPTPNATASADPATGTSDVQVTVADAYVHTCEPVKFSWSGGSGPYSVEVLTGAAPGAGGDEILSQTPEGSYTWVAKAPAGTTITFSVTDSTGAIAYSTKLTVEQGPSTDCLSSPDAVSSLYPVPSVYPTDYNPKPSCKPKKKRSSRWAF